MVVSFASRIGTLENTGAAGKRFTTGAEGGLGDGRRGPDSDVRVPVLYPS